jgi:ribosomal protein S13
MRLTTLAGEFAFAYFDALIDELMADEKRSVKALLTQEQIIPGLGNAIAQDILFRARINPRHPLTDLDSTQRKLLNDAIRTTVNKVIEPGGRYDEFVSEIKSIWSFDRSEVIEAHYLELEPEDIHLNILSSDKLNNTYGGQPCTSMKRKKSYAPLSWADLWARCSLV